jgi:hypothetical protein
MKRLLALVAAALMIGGAVLVRGWLDDGGGSAGDDDPDDDRGDVAVLACDPSLETVCLELASDRDDLDVVIEDAADTRARLEPGSARPDEVGIDGWITIAPEPEIVAEQRERAGLPAILGEPSAPLARSPLVMVGWNERVDVLIGACGQLDWRCVGDRAGAPWESIDGDAGWGRVEPGIDDIERDATALAVGGQAAASFFETADFASNDFELDGFRSWWEDLFDAIPNFPATRSTVLAQMLAAGPASYDVVGATEAHALPTVNASREKDRVTVSYPSPVTTADVVIAPVVDTRGADVIEALATDEDLAAALAADGWRVDGYDLPSGADPDLTLPADTGLPRPGVLEALRRL